MRNKTYCIQSFSLSDKGLYFQKSAFATIRAFVSLFTKPSYVVIDAHILLGFFKPFAFRFFIDRLSI